MKHLIGMQEDSEADMNSRAAEIFRAAHAALAEQRAAAVDGREAVLGKTDLPATPDQNQSAITDEMLALALDSSMQQLGATTEVRSGHTCTAAAYAEPSSGAGVAARAVKTSERRETGEFPTQPVAAEARRAQQMVPREWVTDPRLQTAPTDGVPMRPMAPEPPVEEEHFESWLQAQIESKGGALTHRSNGSSSNGSGSAESTVFSIHSLEEATHAAEQPPGSSAQPASAAHTEAAGPSTAGQHASTASQALQPATLPGPVYSPRFEKVLKQGAKHAATHSRLAHSSGAGSSSASPRQGSLVGKLFSGLFRQPSRSNTSAPALDLDAVLAARIGLPIILDSQPDEASPSQILRNFPPVSSQPAADAASASHQSAYAGVAAFSLNSNLSPEEEEYALEPEFCSSARKAAADQPAMRGTSGCDSGVGELTGEGNDDKPGALACELDGIIAAAVQNPDDPDFGRTVLQRRSSGLTALLRGKAPVDGPGLQQGPDGGVGKLGAFWPEEKIRRVIKQTAFQKPPAEQEAESHEDTEFKVVRERLFGPMSLGSSVQDSQWSSGSDEAAKEIARHATIAGSNNAERFAATDMGTADVTDEQSEHVQAAGIMDEDVQTQLPSHKPGNEAAPDVCETADVLPVMSSAATESAADRTNDPALAADASAEQADLPANPAVNSETHPEMAETAETEMNDCIAEADSEQHSPDEEFMDKDEYIVYELGETDDSPQQLPQQPPGSCTPPPAAARQRTPDRATPSPDRCGCFSLPSFGLSLTALEFCSQSSAMLSHYNLLFCGLGLDKDAMQI